MNIAQALILGVVEGLTEFLPVSSTGHLTIASKIMGLKIDDVSVTAFTAVIQVGAILACILYFRQDIARLFLAWVRGLRSSRARADPDYRLAWMVIVGSLPIGIVGFLLRHVIEGPLRSLWVVAIGLIVWSFVMVFGDAVGRGRRFDHDLTVKDGLILGFAQCLALIPGVSRSGATISTGLILGIDRVVATRISFLLGIPALLGAGGLTLPDALRGGVGAVPTIVGTVVAFFVAYASIAWLLKFVQSNKFTAFALYRVLLGIVVIVLLSTNVLSAT